MPAWKVSSKSGNAQTKLSPLNTHQIHKKSYAQYNPSVYEAYQSQPCLNKNLQSQCIEQLTFPAPPRQSARSGSSKQVPQSSWQECDHANVERLHVNCMRKIHYLFVEPRKASTASLDYKHAEAKHGSVCAIQQIHAWAWLDEGLPTFTSKEPRPSSRQGNIARSCNSSHTSTDLQLFDWTANKVKSRIAPNPDLLNGG